MNQKYSYLPDLLEKDLQIIFIGYNPSIRSAELGHHFAGKSNRFWKVLYLAGLTPVQLSYIQDKELLSYGFGVTNIVDRPTKSAAEIKKEEYLDGKIRLLHKLERYAPKIACFVGAGVYRAFSGREKREWGFQEKPTVCGIKDFVAPNTSGLVRINLQEQVRIYHALTVRNFARFN